MRLHAGTRPWHKGHFKCHMYLMQTFCNTQKHTQVLDPGTKDLTGIKEPLQVNVAMLQVI